MNTVELTGIIDKTPKNLIDDFFDRVGKHRIIDKENLKDLAIGLVRYYRSSRRSKKFAYMKKNDLENRWYKSLESGNADYSVYDDEMYISDLWACWVVYSRYYLKAIQNPKSEVVLQKNQIKKIVDVGCGFGYTTLALKQMFPNAQVIGTNLEDTTQIKVAKEIGSEYGFDVVSDYTKIGRNVDIVFASEYFEHFEKPIEHLLEVVNCTDSRIFIFANSFGTKSTGHFHRYKIDGEFVQGNRVSKKFNNNLKDMGYKRKETKIWNQKPDLWERMTND